MMIVVLLLRVLAVPLRLFRVSCACVFFVYFFFFFLTEFVRLFCPTIFLRGARIADRSPAQREYLQNITNL